MERHTPDRLGVVCVRCHTALLLKAPQLDAGITRCRRQVTALHCGATSPHGTPRSIQGLPINFFLFLLYITSHLEQVKAATECDNLSSFLSCIRLYQSSKTDSSPFLKLVERVSGTQAAVYMNGWISLPAKAVGKVFACVPVACVDMLCWENHANSLGW